MEKTMNKILLTTGLLLALCACQKLGNTTDPNTITFRFHHPSAVTKATDTAFEEGDRAGVFMVYAGETVQLSGNLINNAGITHTGTTWQPDRTYYWPNGTSSCDVVAYYPYMEISSISQQSFAVPADQSSGLSAFDFMWAKTSDVGYENGAVDMTFRHRLTKLKITVAAGGEYQDALPEDMTVRVLNTHLGGLIDFGTGAVTKDSDSPVRGIATHSLGNHVFEGLVIPQSINGRKTPLFEVLASGVSYLFTGIISYVEGYQMNITLILESNPSDIKQGIYIDGQYSNWD